MKIVNLNQSEVRVIARSEETQDQRQVAQPVSRRHFLRTASLILGLSGVFVACGERSGGSLAINNTPLSTPLTPTVATTATSSPGVTPTPSPTIAAATTTPTAQAITTPGLAASTTSPVETARAFLKLWEQKRYPEMYRLLTPLAKNYVTQERFVQRYQEITIQATINVLQADLTAGYTLPPGLSARLEIPFKVTFKTDKVGEFSQDNLLTLQQEQGQWLIEWKPANIFKQLDNTLYTVRLVKAKAVRGNIVDLNSQPLAQSIARYEVAVVPAQVENEEQFLTTLSTILGLDKPKLKELYQSQSGQSDNPITVKVLPTNTPSETLDRLKALQGKGIFLKESQVRQYPQQQLASHVVGYLGLVTAEDLKTLAAKGYTDQYLIGKTGVEDWAEDLLSESDGAELAVTEPNGQVVVETIARQPGVSAPSLVLNLDLDIQRKAEAALAERTGSIVVLNPTNGAVLALANFPGYDPNGFISGLSQEQFKALNDDPRRPFLNRAINGKLPVGSTFKVITTAAALEQLGLNMQTRFSCTGRWTGLGEQNAKECYLKSGHGSITLFEGLAQSCDVVYYELGKRLDELDSNILPQMAQRFGFGSATGMIGLYDSAGQVPDPKWKQAKLSQSWVRGDAVNLGIGQGYFLATPLQLAVAYAAIANGGKLITPRLAERTESKSPQLAKTFAPQVKSQLPVSESNLSQIRQALLAVTQGSAGTARQAFAGFKIAVAGKTGTAESGVEQPHAWFACYAPADQPRYVVVVCLENAGYGNTLAAPTARKLLEQLPF